MEVACQPAVSRVAGSVRFAVARLQFACACVIAVARGDREDAAVAGLGQLRSRHSHLGRRERQLSRDDIAQGESGQLEGGEIGEEVSRFPSKDKVTRCFLSVVCSIRRFSQQCPPQTLWFSRRARAGNQSV